MRKFICCVLMVHLFVSCKTSKNNDKLINTSDIIHSASTLDIRRYDNFTLVDVFKPWQKAGNEKISYLFAGKNVIIPDSLLGVTLIRTPVTSVICFSTTHIGYISALQMTGTVKGISGNDYICDPEILQNLQNGRVRDIGYPPSIDYETILKIKPDIVFLYGLESSVTGIIRRLSEAGINSVMVSDFLEIHPLGKAEWIKFFASLFELEEMGDSIFNTVVENYTNLKVIAGKADKKPLVLTGLPWKDTWYMAGGKSFTAGFIEDAGGKYLWKDNLSDEFIPLSLETVFNKALQADMWINCGTAVSLDDLLSRDPRFEMIKAYREKKVFNNNARMNNSGGNDFWESGVVRADLVLGDLISVFHPGLLDNYELVYYRRLE